MIFGLELGLSHSGRCLPPLVCEAPRHESSFKVSHNIISQYH